MAQRRSVTASRAGGAVPGALPRRAALQVRGAAIHRVQGVRLGQLAQLPGCAAGTVHWEGAGMKSKKQKREEALLRLLVSLGSLNSSVEYQRSNIAEAKENLKRAHAAKDHASAIMRQDIVEIERKTLARLQQHQERMRGEIAHLRELLNPGAKTGRFSGTEPNESNTPKEAA